MSDDEQVNFIDPKLLAQVQEWSSDNVTQINSYTYEIFNATFIVPGELVTVGAMVAFLMENGWTNDDKS